jgi:hypothetical protein
MVFGKDRVHHVFKINLLSSCESRPQETDRKEVVMTRSLPTSPSIRQLKIQAKDLLKARDLYYEVSIYVLDMNQYFTKCAIKNEFHIKIC